MYYSNPNPYISHSWMYHSEELLRQEHAQDLLGGLKREASALNGYHFLVDQSPNEQERRKTMQMMEEKQRHMQQLNDAYVSLTGMKPMYEYDKVDLHHYYDGLQKLENYEMETKNYYQYCYSRAQYPFIQEMYAKFLHREDWYDQRGEETDKSRDYGGKPFTVNIEKATKGNKNYRTALWTGEHLQLTLMSIPVGGDIGLEMHPHLDQFIRLEQGEGLVKMGDSKEQLDFQEKVVKDYAFIIPAGKWHNLVNVGRKDIKLYSIYAPPEHPFGTIHATKEIAMASEEEHDHH